MRSTHQSRQDNSAIYQSIMQSMLERFRAGDYQVGDKIPSEHELVAELGVSRMTVNRALTELATMGYIHRLRGRGSFVADLRPQSSLLDVHNIAVDIAARGHVHTTKVLVLEQCIAAGEVSAALNIRNSTALFHSVILHYEDDLAIQLEERFVKTDFAPDYLSRDFVSLTPYDYLVSMGSIEAVEHGLHAEKAGARERRHLQLQLHDPCLVLTRRTWSQGRIVTFGRFYFPGDRYRLSSRYVPAP